MQGGHRGGRWEAALEVVVNELGRSCWIVELSTSWEDHAALEVVVNELLGRSCWDAPARR